MPSVTTETTLQRRVAGYHDIRLDGMLDLVIRAHGASVMDVGCNRGLVGFEMANNGARLVHGCDNYAEGIATARQLFADLRNCETRFEVVDLTEGGPALKVFGDVRYDIVLMLAVYHKLKRIMDPKNLDWLMGVLGDRTNKWFGWRATSDKPAENDAEMKTLDRQLAPLKRIHTSYISKTLGVAAIWERP
jgi:ribosomal protein L11 methylase PrmA